MWWRFILLSCLRFIFVAVNNVYSISSHFFLLALASPLKLIGYGQTYDKIEEVLFGWLLSQVGVWIYTAGYKIYESGDPLPLGKECLFMPNHQSTADVPYLMALLASKPGIAAKIMWIMDKIFKYTTFGWVASAHQDFFILAGKRCREKSLVDLRNHLKTVFIAKGRKYLVLFPEGGFLRKRKGVSHQFAKKNDLPLLEYCTLPRTGALEVILDVLNCNSSYKSYINKIVDITIAYPEGKPLDLPTIIIGNRPPCTTYFHYRVFDIESLPKDVEELKKWIYYLYIDKEKMLSEYYQTGVWPHQMFNSNSSPPKEMIHDGSYYVLIHFFFIFWFSVLVFFIRTILALF
uniref:Phospholipid/glycerol acyltransferase domain-containing protein n=1 Tax=Lepeophtheirus salmonis TaxID=72036 RepID=A0A0K2UUM2_LEPSM